ncbi:MAG: tRNA 2-thiouridine(34) synthase MnmA, partial [Bacteroidales bacterium]
TLFGDCPWKDDRAIAEMVARKLDIPFHFVDLSEEYSKRVVDYMFQEYKMGRTPNPDVLCNREIKFEAFLRHALELGVDYVATGHYCRKEESRDKDGNCVYRLLAGKDGNKDQSYFLCQLSQEQLSKALFPIGDITKPQVRELAAKAKLPSANKKDSQGICFVGKIDLPVFLQQKLEAKEGNVVEVFNDFYSGNELFQLQDKDILTDCELEKLAKPYCYTPISGKVIGKHQGAHFYTIGQRKGLNIGGHLNPLFVISTDVSENIVYVGEGQDHPGLYRKALSIESSQIHWVRPDLKLEKDERRDLLVRIRYRQPLQEATLMERGNQVFILFKEPQRGITSGQFAAFYSKDELIGSGVIG